MRRRMLLSELRLEIARMLLEYELRDGVTLYHRSHLDMKPGHVIKPNKSEKSGNHWLLDNPGEKQLEEHRRDRFPNRPSRFDSVFMSLSPHARFISKGYLYAVEPRGRMLVTDSRIIDWMYDDIRRGRDWLDRGEVWVSPITMDRYWEGVEPTRENLKDIEVLADSARVIERIDEPSRVMNGKEVHLTEPIDVTLSSVEIHGSIDDAIKDVESKGLRVLTRPEIPYDGDKRPTRIRMNVRVPAGHLVTPLVRLQPASSYYSDAPIRSEIPSVTLIISGFEETRAYLSVPEGMKLLKALKKRRA